jgi:formylglycine-generating enzyme required for sulfatase activity
MFRATLSGGLCVCVCVLSAAACGNDDGGGGAGGSAGSPLSSGGQTGGGGGGGGIGGSGNVTGKSGSSGTQAGQGGQATPQGGTSNAGASSGGGAGSAGVASGGSAGTTGGGGNGGNGGNGGGASTAPPSCATSGPGRTTCGPNGDESCCTSPLVDGGTYSRTYTNMGSGATGEKDTAKVSDFRLDKYEVTVGRFRAFVKYLEEGGAPPATGSGKHGHLNAGKGLADSGKSGSFEAGWDASWNSKIPAGAGAAAKWKALLNKPSSGGAGCSRYGTWTDEPGDNELLPITCTSWYESYAFCIWDDGFLPSEAEWKYATAGGDEQRAYPWGATAPGASSEYAIYDCCYPDGKCSAASGKDTCTGVVNAAPVGFAAKGVGRYGQLDLVGNVWEWNLDRYASYVNPCDDCAYLTGNTTNRVLPGAGFHTGARLGATLLYSYNRSQVSYDAETYRGDYAVGVRCARPM